MANLTAVFELVDRISDKMDAIVSGGDAAVQTWEGMERAANSAFNAAETAAQNVISTVVDFQT